KVGRQPHARDRRIRVEAVTVRHVVAEREIARVVHLVLLELAEDEGVAAPGVPVVGGDWPVSRDAERAAVVAGVIIMDWEADLLQVVHALGSSCRLARGLNRW